MRAYQIKLMFLKTKTSDGHLLRTKKFVWVKTHLTKMIIPQTPAEKKYELEYRREWKRDLQHRADLAVAIVEATTAKHFDHLGLQKKRRKMSRAVVEKSDGVRITAKFPTGTFIKRIMNAAMRYDATYIPHHIYEKGFEVRTKMVLHNGEYIRKDERFKVIGMAVSIYDFELFMLNMFAIVNEQLGTVWFYLGCDDRFFFCVDTFSFIRQDTQLMSFFEKKTI